MYFLLSEIRRLVDADKDRNRNHFFIHFFCYVTKYLNTQHIPFLKNKTKIKFLSFRFILLGFYDNATKMHNKHQDSYIFYF